MAKMFFYKKLPNTDLSNREKCSCRRLHLWFLCVYCVHRQDCQHEAKAKRMWQVILKSQQQSAGGIFEWKWYFIKTSLALEQTWFAVFRLLESIPVSCRGFVARVKWGLALKITWSRFALEWRTIQFVTRLRYFQELSLALPFKYRVGGWAEVESICGKYYF